MYVSNSFMAANLLNQSKLVNGKLSKSTERLSSGYRINRAADDSANLAISEKMRAQIRGLSRASTNIQDGMSYVQVADGAMGDAHAIMQRMRELSVQAINDTNTGSDRSAIEQEFNELQSQLDDIFDNTQFNGENVFESHEDHYASITGNVYWNHDQKHTILSTPNGANELKISLQKDHDPLFTPDEITVTIPEGIYTTHELVDEIEDRLSKIEIKPVAQLKLEYLKNGFCNVNLEGQVGIDSIDGGLTYLIYGGASGGGGGKIIGTTTISAGYPLVIRDGKNDTLSFHTFNMEDGTSGKDINIKFPPGDYSRDQIIDYINGEIKKQDPNSNAKAIPEGSSCISLSAGYEMIVGLSGNMFEIDSGVKYHSVFYDNRETGTVKNTNGVVNGAAYYNSLTEKVNIEAGVNDKLGISVDGKNYVDITIPEKEYTMDELKTALQSEFDSKNVDVNVSIQSTYKRINGVWGSYQSLVLTTKSKGEDSVIKFKGSDKDVPAGDEVYAGAYKSLLCSTNITHRATYGSGGSVKAGLSGSADLSKGITFQPANSSLKLNIDGTPYTYNFNAGKNYSLDDIISHLNNEFKNAAGTNGALEAYNNGGKLAFRATGTGGSTPAKSITVDHSGAYKDLFVKEIEAPKKVSVSGSGVDHWIEGNTKPTSQDPARITLAEYNGAYPYTIPSSIKIDDSNQTFKITVNGKQEEIKLDKGTYTHDQLVTQLNYKFNYHSPAIGVEASFSGNSLVFTTTEKGGHASLSISSDDNPALGGMVGTYKYVYNESVTTESKTPAFINGDSLTDRTEGGNVIIYDGTGADDPYANHQLKFKFDDGTGAKDFNVTLSPGAYSMEELRKKLQDACDNQLGSGMLKVSVNESGGVDFTSAPNVGGAYKIQNVTGGFYKYVISTTSEIKERPTIVDGTHAIEDAFIVGRNDMTESKEILAGKNDQLSLKFSYPDKGSTKEIKIDMTLNPGNYSGDQMIAEIQKKLDEQLVKKGLPAGMIKAQIGGVSTGVSGNIDNKALVFKFMEPDGFVAEEGDYVIDSISGSAAYSVFYKSTGVPQATYIVGTQNIANGVVIDPNKTEFGLTVDGTEYKVDLDPGPYTKDELLEHINKKFEDIGVPVKSTMTPDGFLRLYYDEIAEHTLSNITGNAKGTIFYKEIKREENLEMIFQVGHKAGDDVHQDKLNLSTALLGINSITLSGRKYAEKALERLDKAINMLSEARVQFGALYNRFEHMYNYNKNAQENTQASESRIRDTNMAKEMVTQTKHQAISQIQNSLYSKVNQQSASYVSSLFEA